MEVSCSKIKLSPLYAAIATEIFMRLPPKNTAEKITDFSMITHYTIKNIYFQERKEEFASQQGTQIPHF